MADVTAEFTVEDTSPTISYSPFGDTFSVPNLGAGWNPYFDSSGFVAAQGDIGNGTSLHLTSLDGASLSIQWHGTGIQLFGNATLASYSINLDGQPFNASAALSNGLLAEIQGLEDTLHVVSLTAHISSDPSLPNSSMMVFDKAVIFSSPFSSSSAANFSSEILNDDSIAFLGQWSFQASPNGTAAFHTSARAGDRAVSTFTGTTLLVQGITSPTAGNYTVTIDNVTSTSRSLSARSSFTAFDTLLFYSSGLDPTATHYVEVRNDGGGDLALLVSGFTTLTPLNLLPSPPSSVPSTAGAMSSSSFNKGEIAAFILSGILAFLLLTGTLYYFFVYRPRRRRHRQSGRTWSDRLKRQSKEREAAAAAANNEEVGATAIGTPIVIDISSEAMRQYDQYDPEHDQEDDQDDTEENYRYGYGWTAKNAPAPNEHEYTSATSSSGFTRWKKTAVEGSPGGANLPIDFTHSDGSKKSPRLGVEELQYDSALSSPASPSESLARRTARMGAVAAAKIKGKAKQITGKRSPSFHLDLPVWTPRSKGQLRASGGSATSPHSPGVDIRVSAFVAAPRSPNDDAEPPSYTASVSQSGSHPNSNPSSQMTNGNSLPSVPRTVSSRSPVVMPARSSGVANPSQQYGAYNSHIREDSGGYLLDIEGPREGQGQQQLRHDRGNRTGDNDDSESDAIGPDALQQAIRTLSPRTASHPRHYTRHSYDYRIPGGGASHRRNDTMTSSELDPVDSGSSVRTRYPSEPLLPLSPPPPTLRPPPKKRRKERENETEVLSSSMANPTEGSQDSETQRKDDVFLIVEQSSPFRVDFDINALQTSPQSTMPATTSSDSEGMYVTADSNSRPPPPQSQVEISESGSSGSQLPAISSEVGLPARPPPLSAVGTSEFVEGSSRQPFHLSPLSFPKPPTGVSGQSSVSADSPVHGPGGSQTHASFLDFTSSYEPSLASQKHYSRSIKTSMTGGSSEKESRPTMPFPFFLDREPEPRSRWSGTTQPSMVTKPGSTNSNNTKGGPSHSGSEQPSPLTTKPPEALRRGQSSTGATGSGSRSGNVSDSSNIFPIPVQMDIPPSPHHQIVITHDDAEPPSLPSDPGSLTSIFTQNVEHLHVHPAGMDTLDLVDSIPDSPTESIPMSLSSDVRFRHSVSEDVHSRRTTSSSPHHPGSGINALHSRLAGTWTTSTSSAMFNAGRPPPTSTQGSRSTPTIEEEVNRRPFDPSILVSRVLGLPSSTSTLRSSSTVRPPPITVGGNHSRNQSSTSAGGAGRSSPQIPPPTRSFSPFPSSPRFDSLRKNEQKKDKS